MRRLLLCLLLVTAAPVAARAQDTAPAQTEAAAPTADPAAPAVADDFATTQSNGLPVTAPPPRTLRAYWHVFIAFAIAWALLFGYVVVLGRRFGSLEREIKRLEGTGV